MKQANTNYVSVIIAVLAAVGLLGFCIGVAHACIVSWCPCNNDLTSFSKYEGFALKTIAGILATHLGAVLGIKVVSAGSSGLRDIVSDPMHDAFNVAACIIYLLALIVTVWIFQRHHFNEDDKSIVPIIPDFAKSLLGFIIGALTSVLVVKTTAANSFRTREARAKIFQIAKKGSDAVTRPNTYEGTHFYDLDGELMWANGADGSACGTEKWFFVTKKPGDKYENIGTCAGGMDKYRITLVA